MNNSQDGSVLHFNSVRLRVTGSGNLLQSLFSLDDVKSKTLFPVVMEETNYKEPLTLTNFTDQRACYEFRTVGFQEVFNISKIVIFVRKTATGYPQ